MNKKETYRETGRETEKEKMSKEEKPEKKGSRGHEAVESKRAKTLQKERPAEKKKRTLIERNGLRETALD